MRVRRALAIVGAAFAVLALAAPAQAARPFAPLGQDGPKLRHDRADLRASLTCTDDLRNAKRKPVLLLSGTTVTPDENFAWNWMPALTAERIPWCASAAPNPDNMEDVQARGEYIVYAIRRMYRLAGRRIAIFGHSQGGMVGRWALRFWPDTRRKVSDVVGAAPSNRGTDSAEALCSLGSCPPAFWQQRTSSAFTRALNSRTETFRRVSYTNVYTRLDVIVIPNGTEDGRSALAGPGKITNVAVQEVCPANLSDHLALGTIDPLAWELFLDAASHRGPAAVERVGTGACSKAFMPGVEPATVATDLAAAAAALATTSATHPHVPAEPPLRRYVFSR